jgi:hypothetical protein
MAKKQTPKRTVRTKKVRKPEPVAQKTEVVEKQMESPAAAISVAEEHFAPPPSKWRDRLLIFALTLVGTLAGVWIGSSLLSNPGTHSAARQASEAQMEGERKQSREVLVAIQEELVENARILKQRRASGQVDPKSAGSSFLILRDDFWTALVHNSEMRWVTDVQLLRTIAKAYYYINEIKALERKSAVDKNSQKYFPELTALAEKSIVDAAVAIDQKLVASFDR